MTSAPRPANALDSVGPLVRVALWIAIAITAGYHLGVHVAALRLPPMGSWETVYAGIARVWPQQYQWVNYVQGHDGYGPGYPAFVRPFLAGGLELYLAHRVANLATLLGACGVLWVLLRSVRAPGQVRFAAIAIFYALNAGSYSIQARPDFLTLLEALALLGLGQAVASGRVAATWLTDLALGLLALCAFFTKAYTVAIWGAIVGYNFFFVDRRRALRCGAVGAAVLLAGVAVFAATNPLYWMEVFQGQVVQAAPSFEWFVHQVADFALLACGLIAVAIAGWAYRHRTHVTAPTEPRELKTYWCWQLVVAAVVLVVGPGWHTGAYLTYFLHLLLVPLTVVAAMAGPREPGIFATARDIALTANLAILMLLAPSWPVADSGWPELREDVLREPGRVAVDYLLEPLAREKAGLHVVSTGMTNYTVKEPFLIGSASPTVARARTAASAFLAAEQAWLFGDQPVDTLYLDCLILRSAGNRPSLIPRNELPYFLGPEMYAYSVAKVFSIRPYYFATNAPRQKAGTAETAIVKFVRRNQDRRR